MEVSVVLPSVSVRGARLTRRATMVLFTVKLAVGTLIVPPERVFISALQCFLLVMVCRSCRALKTLKIRLAQHVSLCIMDKLSPIQLLSLWVARLPTRTLQCLDVLVGGPLTKVIRLLWSTRKVLSPCRYLLGWLCLNPLITLRKVGTLRLRMLRLEVNST